MDTNLKTSKKIRLFFYKIICVAACFTMLATAWMGREAFYVLTQEGPGILTGDIYYLPQFRTYISKLYYYGMTGYIGVSADTNHLLLGQGSQEELRRNSQIAFEQEFALGGDDLLYHIYRDRYGNYTISSGNIDSPLYSALNGNLLLPSDLILCCYWNGSTGQLLFFDADKYQPSLKPEQYFTYQYSTDSADLQKSNFIIAIKDTVHFTSDYLKGMARLATDYQRILLTFAISAGCFFLFAILNLFCHKSIRIMLKQMGAFTGKIILEGKLLILVAVYLLGYYYYLWNFPYSQQARFHAIPYLPLYGVIAAVAYLLLNDIRYNRVGVLKNSFLVYAYQHIKRYIKESIWYRKAVHLYLLYYTAGVFTILAGVLLCYLNNNGILYHVDNSSRNILYIISVILLLFGVLMLLLGVRLKRFISDTMTIGDHLASISNGKPQSDITLCKNSLLNHVALDVQDIQKGITTAVEDSLRSNRMRVELITNVSHDLKTPLTSIINYSDLLCEENLPAPAGEYATALRQKAYRLKGMVQDVFELSKATSGNLPLEMVQLDLTKLIYQTLADMDERIQQSTLTFKLDILTAPLMIEADGEKLYRIFQNLIVNALQYSLENSRVYIQLDKQGTNAFVWIKNISKQELDFDPTEIVERFVRADASRTTEGSGLGLSIAQSFTEACGGTFAIELNADLFTACVSFPLSKEPLEEIKKHEETK